MLSQPVCKSRKAHGSIGLLLDSGIKWGMCAPPLHLSAQANGEETIFLFGKKSLDWEGVDLGGFERGVTRTSHRYCIVQQGCHGQVMVFGLFFFFCDTGLSFHDFTGTSPYTEVTARHTIMGKDRYFLLVQSHGPNHHGVIPCLS